MPLQKIMFKPGVNRENTRYTTEGGWYECDKIRFRQGNPEKIGGWTLFSGDTFLGACRSLWNWVTTSFVNLIGLGTNLKFYINSGGAYYDITPIRATTTLGTNPFTGNNTPTVQVYAPAHGALNGDFVTFSGSTDSRFNGQFQISFIDVDYYNITAATSISAGSYGGSAVVATYQLNTGPAYQVSQSGWGGGNWGYGDWNVGTTTVTAMQLWSQSNYGSDLVFGPRGGGVYYWANSSGVSTRGVNLNTLGGSVTFTAASPAVVTLSVDLTEGSAVQFAASGSLPSGISASTTYYLFNVNGVTANLIDSAGAVINTTTTGSGVYISKLVDVPTVQNTIFVSDIYRFIFTMGCNDYGSSTLDPMLIRWSDQDNPYVWTPDATNQAGSVRLSHGSKIVTAIQARQEIVVFTDASVYSLQYQGPPVVWGAQLLGDNVSIIGPNSVAIASGVVFWMGVDKFYMYDGRVQTLSCDLRRYIFQDFNPLQAQQVYASTNEGFNEVWWFYCSSGSNWIDRYVVYNYVEQVWYYGTLARTAWLDSGLQPYPLATQYDPDTGTSKLLYHENGVDDVSTGNPVAIEAYISSSEFDIGDGHNFGYVWRVLPDLTFADSTTDSVGNQPQVTMYLYPLANSGSGTGSPGTDTVTKVAAYNITEEFTGIVYTRVRGRQLIFKIKSDQVGTTWQLGAPRIDIRPDGRR